MLTPLVLGTAISGGLIVLSLPEAFRTLLTLRYPDVASTREPMKEQGREIRLPDPPPAYGSMPVPQDGISMPGRTDHRVPPSDGAGHGPHVRARPLQA
ncbi:MAG TPA: hypothetical protein VEZ16_17950 [Microvirga sp.]|nr:hypothetical protein [Microvirga sp.]